MEERAAPATQERRGKGQGQQQSTRPERNDRQYGRGQSWEEAGYGDEPVDQGRRPPRGADKGERRSDDRSERRRKVPAERERQQTGKRDGSATDSEKPIRDRRQPPGRGGTEGNAESHASNYRY